MLHYYKVNNLKIVINTSTSALLYTPHIIFVVWKKAWFRDVDVNLYIVKWSGYLSIEDQTTSVLSETYLFIVVWKAAGCQFTFMCYSLHYHYSYTDKYPHPLLTFVSQLYSIYIIFIYIYICKLIMLKGWHRQNATPIGLTGFCLTKKKEFSGRRFLCQI